jgi:hypothetical protein
MYRDIFRIATNASSPATTAAATYLHIRTLNGPRVGRAHPRSAPGFGSLGTVILREMDAATPSPGISGHRAAGHHRGARSTVSTAMWPTQEARLAAPLGRPRVLSQA